MSFLLFNLELFATILGISNIGNIQNESTKVENGNPRTYKLLSSVVENSNF